MADATDDVPPIPVPPVEPAVIPPIVDLAGSGAAAQPNPYAPVAVDAPANPYASAAPAYQAQPYGYPGYAPAPPTGLSIASMILGIAGIFFGILVSIAAVITGHIARKSQPHARAMWLTGLITGYVGIGLWALFIIAYVIFIIVMIGVSSSYDGGYYS